MTEDRTDQDAAGPAGDSGMPPGTGAGPRPEDSGVAETGAPPDRPTRDADGAADSADAATPGPGRRGPRPSTEGVGTQLPPGLRDLAAAVRAIERGERPAAAAPARRADTGAPAGPARSAAPAPVAMAPQDAASSGSPASGGGAAAASQTSGPRPPGTPDPERGHPAVPASADAVAGARAVLAAGGAPESLAQAAVAALGERAGELLRDDPWQILGVPGVRVEQADGFARALLGSECGPDDERRVRALVGWLLERAAEQGHTALESSVLRAALGKQSVTDPEEGLRAAVAGGQVLLFHDAVDAPGGAAKRDEEEDQQPVVRLLFGLDRYALAEESLADGLNRLLNTFNTFNTFGTFGPDRGGTEEDPTPSAPDPSRWEAAAAAAPSPSAAALIRAAAGSGLVVHTGGEAARAEPALLVSAARTLGLRAYAAAFTEDGRRRLVAAIGDAALTVGGLLTGGEGPGRAPDGALALDLLAVLDAPQLDVEAAATLVEAVPDGARLVLSGDPGVLWSAGPGRAFADLLAAKTCPQVVSRTPDPGPIGELVSGIRIGELEQVEAPGKEIVIVPVRDAGEAVHRTVQLVADSVPRAIGVPAEQTQVITPGHGGAAGTRVLNAALKERLNPGPGRFAGFDPGDRVVHVPAPGRAVPGTVVTADAEGLHLDCGGTPVVVPRQAVAPAVRHGWAITAHQAAGMRWPAAVVVLPGDAAGALSRAWVYTAFSRAERHLSVVHGVDQALPRAVADVPARERTTRLRAVLREQAGGPAR